METFIFFIQSSIKQPLIKEFSNSHIWAKKIMKTPKFDVQQPYCHQFEKDEPCGNFKYVRTIER